MDKYKEITGSRIVSATWQSKIKSMIREGYTDNDILEDCLNTKKLFDDPEFKSNFINTLTSLATGRV